MGTENEEITKNGPEIDSAHGQESQVTEVDDTAPAEPGGMAQKDAIRAAIAKVNSGVEPEKPTQAEQKTAVDDELEPPRGFSKEAQDAWRKKDYKRVNQEWDRLCRERDKEVGRVQTRERQLENETKPIKDLTEKVKNYLTVRGDEAPDEVKIAQALQLVSELKKGDAKAVKAELLKAGIDLDATTPEAKEDQSKIDALQATVNELMEDKKTTIYKNAVQTFSAVYEKLGSQKTRTGQPVFPDFLDNSEAGLQFGKELGSLIQDAKFQQGVLRRFPEADLVVLTREAYKYLGGRIAGEPTKESPKSNQQHIIHSRRAAASTPGRSTSTKSSSDLIGKLGRKAAIRAAIAEAEGH